MAIAATLLGGILGFISFLIALLVLDYSFISAFMLYMATSIGTIALTVANAFLRFRSDEAEIRTGLRAP